MSVAASSATSARRWARTPARATPAAAPEIGDPASTGVRWGRLLLQERVGAGVYGEVYRAFDESLRRDVAVKLLRASGRSAELLAAKVLNEGRLLARVSHRNVVTVHGVDTHDGRVGLWMEFIRGNTLEQLLERQGPFGGREASLLGQDLCRALAAVHAAGLVHRDVKAQNVIREEGGRLVLMDFGTGLLLEDDEAVKASPVAGTPLYLSPEVLAGADASPQSDIYSLGVLLFHLVTGSYPYVARSLTELRRMHDRGERKRLHDLRPDLSEGFVHVVERALESDPTERYASVGAMQRGLTHALGLESGLMAPVTLAAIAADTDATLRGSSTLSSTGTAARPVVRASRWKVWLPLLLAAALAAGVAAWLTRHWWSAAASPVAPSPLASLVVEPFEVVSSGDRALAEGIGEVVMERVRLLPGVRVVSFTPATAETASTAEAVLTRHQVDGLVRGTATWNDGLARVRVTVLRAGGGAPVFEQAFERPVERAAELPRLVANEMVRGLGVHASSEESSRLSRADDASPAAFEAYLRGRLAMRHLSEVNVGRAIEHFNQALAVNRNHGAVARRPGRVLPAAGRDLRQRAAGQGDAARPRRHRAGPGARRRSRRRHQRRCAAAVLSRMGRGRRRARVPARPRAQPERRRRAPALRDVPGRARSHGRGAVAGAVGGGHRPRVDTGASGAGHGVVLHRQPAAGGGHLPRRAGHRRALLAGPQGAGAGPARRQAVREGARDSSTAGRRARPIRRIGSSSRRAASRWRERGSCRRRGRLPTSCCPARRRMGKWTPRRCWSRWATGLRR